MEFTLTSGAPKSGAFPDTVEVAVFVKKDQVVLDAYGGCFDVREFAAFEKKILAWYITLRNGNTQKEQ